ncbi:cellulase family glycosylhydrolase [Candidatus Marinimicrobia bacterium]|nr:cellulase family glycosylhydrolase [Candidatus Neomarinimicrobiota bacterium]
MAKNLISIKNLDVKYITNKKPIHAVKNVSFDIKKGEIFGLVGESGCGKSTVVQSIIRTLNPPAIITNGYIKYDNKDILSLSVSEVRKLRWSQISIVMQSALNALNPVLTIKEQIIDVFITHKGMSKFEAVEKSKVLLELVDINNDRLESYALEVIEVIRSIDPDNLIIVGSPEWSQRIDLAAQDPITTFANIAYTLHFYTVYHQDWLRERATAALDSGIAIFISEWGSIGYSIIDLEVNKWMSWCHLNKVSHVNWSVNDKEEEWSIVVPGASVLGQWQESDLTAAGKLAKNIISNWPD